jgi:hypothetical protein
VFDRQQEPDYDSIRYEREIEMDRAQEFLPPRLRHVWQRWRAIETHASWFVLVNFLDAAFTWILLTRGNQEGDRNVVFMETNRFAAYFLDRWGLKGLFAFKLGLVVFVCLIGLMIAMRHEERARGVLKFGTLVATGVVLYSVWLYAR